MKKVKFFLPLFSLVLLASCVSNNSSDNTVHQGGNNIEETLNNSDSANLFAYEAATSIGLLATIDSTPVKQANRTASDTASLVDLVASYLPSIEAALWGDQILLENKVTASDREGYETKLEVTYKDIASSDVSFVMYYNETPIRDDDYDFDDRFDDEEESRIDGVVVIGESEYEMRGAKERDGDEFEVSFSYHLDEGNYVRVSQEVERDEQEFQYEVYENRRVIHSYSLEMEENEVELHSASIGDNLYLEFAFFNRNGKTLISCHVVENGQRERMLFEKVVLEDGTSSYQLVQ